METIQNIVLAFDSNVVSSYCDDHAHYPDNVTNIDALKSAVNNSFDVSASLLVIQYTKDQYGSNGPRIVVNMENADPLIITFTDIEENYSDLNDQLVIIKAEVQVFVDNE